MDSSCALVLRSALPLPEDQPVEGGVVDRVIEGKVGEVICGLQVVSTPAGNRVLSWKSGELDDCFPIHPFVVDQRDPEALEFVGAYSDCGIEEVAMGFAPWSKVPRHPILEVDPFNAFADLWEEGMEPVGHFGRRCFSGPACGIIIPGDVQENGAGVGKPGIVEKPEGLSGRVFWLDLLKRACELIEAASDGKAQFIANSLAMLPQDGAGIVAHFGEGKDTHGPLVFRESFRYRIAHLTDFPELEGSFVAREGHRLLHRESSQAVQDQSSLMIGEFNEHVRSYEGVLAQIQTSSLRNERTCFLDGEAGRVRTHLDCP